MEKKIKFVRWGNLNPVKHKEARGASEDTWYHVAPCYKGIYAFPIGYIEPFLLGGPYGDKRTHLLKKDDKLIMETEFYSDYNGTIRPEFLKFIKKKKIRKRDLTTICIDDVFFMAYMDRPKIFNYEGDIWHHLGGYLDKKDILDSKHGWYKTSFEKYLKALHKRDVDDRFASYMMLSKGNRHGNPHTCPSVFSKDDYEVFIEHVK